jgi:hypothetical protein
MFGGVNAGAGDNERVGKCIKHIDFDFAYGLALAQGVACGNVRVIIGVVRGRLLETFSTNPQLFLNNWTGVPPNDQFNIMRNYEYESSKSIKILYDTVYNLQATVAQSGASFPISSAYTEKIIKIPTIKHVEVQEYWDTGSGSENNMQHFYLIQNGPNSSISFRYNAENHYVDQ